jgi:RNA polymerase sigma-70 factor (ECF subfamily)
LDERQLIQQILAGSPPAERAFYDAHVDRVFRLAYRMCGDESLAQEYTQESFVRAFASLGDFRGEARLSTWMHRIAVSVVLNGLRRVKRHRQREVEMVEEHHNIKGQAAPVGLKRLLETAVQKLTGDARAVLVLHDIEGYQHREIGEILGIPVGTSKARLSRAREFLRHELQKTSMEWT